MEDHQTIALGYIGVHQIFQLALAAHEAGKLERLYCSLVDAPGKYGRLLASVSKAASLHPLGLDQLPSDRITELPLPLLSRRFCKFLRPHSFEDYFPSNQWFDLQVAHQLKRSGAHLFVGTETCALESFKEAGRRGMKKLLDCPGMPSWFLRDEVIKAADNLGLTCEVTHHSSRMHERVAAEIESADAITVCSEVQKTVYTDLGVPSRKMHVSPLWVDPAFLQSSESMSRSRKGPLKVLIVGKSTVAKGVPYALQAIKLLRHETQLTLCGGVDRSVRDWAGSSLDKHNTLGWKTKFQLPDIYRNHDVLLFPSLGDSFGFVALEAMACGLPVITTTHVGAPMPDPSWRVAPHDAEALAQRLDLYACDRDRLSEDSALARTFVKQFTPENYRLGARAIFNEVTT